MNARRLCLPILLLGLALGASGVAAADLVGLVEGLASPEQAVRFKAYQGLNQVQGTEVIALLVKALPGCPEMGQYYGMLVLQRQPPKLTQKGLERLARSDSTHLRVLAATALLRRGESDFAGIIVKALRSTEVDTRLRTVLLTRIYNLRHESIQEAVRGLLVPRSDPAVLAGAIYNVFLVRDAAAQPALRRLIRNEDGEARALAAACLLLLGDAEAVPALAESFATGAVSGTQLYKIKSILSQTRPVPKVVLEAMLARVEQETNPLSLRILVEILGEHGFGKAVPALRRLLDHENALVAKAAFAALSRFEGALTAETLRALLPKGSDARRLAAADALRRIDDSSGLDVVLEILAGGEGDLDRSEAARILAGFRVARVVEPLLDALLDPHLSVRTNAFGSLGTVLRSLFPYRRLDLSTVGYVTSGPAPARKAAAARLRAWWVENHARDW